MVFAPPLSQIDPRSSRSTELIRCRHPLYVSYQYKSNLVLAFEASTSNRIPLVRFFRLPQIIYREVAEGLALLYLAEPTQFNRYLVESYRKMQTVYTSIGEVAI